MNEGKNKMKNQRKKNDLKTIERRERTDKAVQTNRDKNDALTSGRRSKADEILDKKRSRNDDLTIHRRKINDRNSSRNIAISLGIVLVLLAISLFYTFLR